MESVLCFKCPIGYIKIVCENDFVTEVKIIDEPVSSTEFLSEEALKCKLQLEEYFEGKRKEFDLRLDAKGTPFRKTVWNELLKVPYGKTATYKDIAKSISKPKAVRAVGGANHNNPIWIIIPCHRIIGSNGSLTGYGGGIWRKEYLLKLENTNK